MIEIGTYEEGGIKVTMVTNDLTYLYIEAVKRLMRGVREDPDGAIAELKATYPDRVQAIIDRLEQNPTPEGIDMFEASFRKGMKTISRWETG
ncbi:hypothetical protein KAR91_17520 [Candidatus Pacearchaeota archaeon]|nr:hypothetical protein [Candidatus Pacearchaeota archaeon]